MSFNPLVLVGYVFRKVFGSRNDRLIKRFARQATLVSAQESEARGDYDARFAARSAEVSNDLPAEERAAALQAIRVELSGDLRERAAALRARLGGGETVEAVLPQAFSLIREASRRARDHRHFDCQLVGGQVLFEGKVAEMRTGEGKTIVCYLPTFLKVLQGKKVHVVTVNDYLVQRDANFAKPIFELLGFSVGFIQSQLDPGGHQGIRRQAYACDVTYGTNNEFGFDYLRDNMKVQLEDQVQGRLDFAIIDEVDSILIDEARTPLIISGPAEDDVNRYRTADQVARAVILRQTAANQETAERLGGWGDEPPREFADRPKFESAFKKFKADPLWLTEDEGEALGHQMFFVCARERKSVHLTHDGIGVAQEQLGVGSLYQGANMEWPHLIENAVRAHVVYDRDVDYVVKDGEVIIVDEFTGRLMHGRQWSDGLHQAVEAKEGVRIKEETQTLATITLQNFFKLYDRIAGMTGTAMTESDEFMKIYKLEVVAVPTNRAVNRQDHNDRIYKTVEGKFDAIVEEVHEVHSRGRPGDPFLLEQALRGLKSIVAKGGGNVAAIDGALADVSKLEKASLEEMDRITAGMTAAYDAAMGDLGIGRPILVGTVSVENSEKLSKALERKHGITHEVLNAKFHEREAEIVAKAGQVHDPVRGKEKRPLGNVTIATNMAGRGTDIKLVRGVVYSKCVGDLGPPAGAPAGRWKWNETGVIGTKCCINCPDYDAKTQCAHCWKPKLDPRFPELGRKVCAVNVPCGLHIVGTERHESRRIDNQLRGRSGRQGDPGSSRFFLSLQDDLLKLFMGDWMLKMLEKLGFDEGMAIEAKSINKGIERAQKKVEERNFSIRKHLLEYDEVMDHQRQVFYRQRQSILESSQPGRSQALIDLIWKMIDDGIEAARAKYLAREYPAQCIADWVRGKLDCTLEAKGLVGRELVDLERDIRQAALDEARQNVANAVGEHMDGEVPPDQWDIRGLSRWAETRFGGQTIPSQNQLRKMQPDEVERLLIEAAEAKCEAIDLTPLERFLADSFGRESFIEWARGKFGIEFPADDLAKRGDTEMLKLVRDTIRTEYQRREVSYPVEWALQRTVMNEQGDNAYAAAALAQWANFKFNVGWTVDQIRNRPVKEVAETLLQLNRDYITNGKLEAEVDRALSAGGDVQAWAKQRLGPCYSEGLFESGAPQRDAILRARALMRYELTMLERYVLLQIYDQAWKDHMHAMDLLKEAIGLRGFAEQDPKIAYKREGFKMFQEMLANIQDRVTGIIFKVRLFDDVQARSAYNIRQAQHAESTNMGFSGQADADRAAAMQAQGTDVKKVETIRREQPRVGRNDPCHCGSGKKFKNCHGKGAPA